LTKKQDDFPMDIPLTRSSSKGFQSLICNPQSAIFIASTLMVIVSWRRWMSPIVDSGRELDLPLRLLRGEMLYRDVHYLYPPFSPYFNALLYRLFTPHIDVLQASGLVCAALVIIFCYRIARRLIPPFGSIVAVVAIIIWSVFKPSGNLVFPYSFAALHGMVLALAVLLMTLRYAEKRRPRELLAAGALIGLTAITKQEFALAGAATAVAAVLYLDRTDIKRLILNLLAIAAPLAAITLPVYGFLIYSVGLPTLVEDSHLFYTHLPRSLVIYNSHRSGMDNPLSSLTQMIGGATVGSLIASAIIAFSLIRVRRRSPENFSDPMRRMLRRATGSMLLFCLIIVVISVSLGTKWDGSPLRALPFFLIGMIGVEWVRGRERRSETGMYLFILSVYSLAVLARVAMRVPSGGAFGSFFLPTSLILIVYVLNRSLPDLAAAWTDSRIVGDYVRRFGLGLIVTLIAITFIVFSVRFRHNFRTEVETSRGNFFTRTASGEAMNQAIAFIQSHTGKDEAIGVAPEGSDLAFLSARRMIFRYPIMHPDFMDEREEKAAIERLQRAGVRYIVIVNRPMREFGAEAFGRDYNQILGGWIEENFRVVKVCGQNTDPAQQIGDPDFFIKILQSK
jgi:4-amino-4-deoxy-L-arabinose transferase-like glycosyltransferase